MWSLPYIIHLLHRDQFIYFYFLNVSFWSPVFPTVFKQGLFIYLFSFSSAPCSMWGLSSLTRSLFMPPALAAWNLNHCTTGKSQYARNRVISIWMLPSSENLILYSKILEEFSRIQSLQAPYEAWNREEWNISHPLLLLNCQSLISLTSSIIISQYTLFCFITKQVTNLINISKINKICLQVMKFWGFSICFKFVLGSWEIHCFTVTFLTHYHMKKSIDLIFTHDLGQHFEYHV